MVAIIIRLCEINKDETWFLPRSLFKKPVLGEERKRAQISMLQGGRAKGREGASQCPDEGTMDENLVTGILQQSPTWSP